MADIFDALKILIVEDDYEGRSLLKVMLHQIGIVNVIESRNGQEALDLIRSVPDGIDMILCDWNMPGMDGPSLLEHVRGHAHYIPFMMITGRGDVASVTEARGFPIDGYLRKPFFPTLLEAKLRAVLYKMAVRAA